LLKVEARTNRQQGCPSSDMVDRVSEAQAATDPSLADRATYHEPDVCMKDADQHGTGQDDASAAGGLRPLKFEALLSVAWTFPSERSISQGQPDYLDSSCLVYAGERLLDVVDFRGAHSAAVGSHSNKASSATYEWSAGRGRSAGVLHSGDVMSAEGGLQVIRAWLPDLPECATDVYFAISAYNCRNLMLFSSFNVRLQDADTPSRPLAQLRESDVPPRTSAVLVCALRRRLDEWTVHSLNRPCEATVRDYSPIEAAIAPLQECHVLWRRRRPLVVLAALWNLERAVLIDKDVEDGEVGGASLVVSLLTLPHTVFQDVVRFV